MSPQTIIRFPKFFLPVAINFFLALFKEDDILIKTFYPQSTP